MDLSSSPAAALRSIRANALITRICKELTPTPPEQQENPELFYTLKAAELFGHCETSRKALQGMCRTEPQRRLLSFLTHKPWRFAIVNARASPKDAFLKISDKSGEFYLHSPQACSLYRRGARRLFALLLYNGICLQSWGQVVSLDRFDEKDLHYFSSLFSREASTRALFRLSAFSHLPRPRVRGQELCRCVSMMLYKSQPDMSRCRCIFTLSESGPILRYQLGDLQLHPPVLYVDRERSCLELCSMSRENYRKARMALLPLVQFPMEPDIVVSGAMDFAAERISGKSFPYPEAESKFLKGFKDSSLGGELTRLCREAGRAYSSGEEGKGDAKLLVAELCRLTAGSRDYLSVDSCNAA